MWNWIKTHPQRTSGLLLSVFGSVQTALAMYQANLPPLVSSIITAAFGIVVTVLAWVQKNFADKEPIPQQETP